MDILINVVKKHQFPIKHISPTHVGRTEDLFMQSLDFAKMGGMIDITTGASQFTDPHKQVELALKKGVKIDNLTFSSDGHAGLAKKGSSLKKDTLNLDMAPVDYSLREIQKLIQISGIPPEEALKLLTRNPAKNLGISDLKGSLELSKDADICIFNKDWRLEGLFSRGKELLRAKYKENKIIIEHMLRSTIQPQSYPLSQDN